MRSTTAVGTEAGGTRPDGPAEATPPVRVLFVTGAYYPEISAAGVQCRAAAAALRGRAACSVVTTAVDASLARTDVVDGVAVHRVAVDAGSRWSKVRALLQFAAAMRRAARTADVVHIHGFSQKNVAATILARWLRKPLVLTLHTAGQDEPEVVRRRGRLAYWAFRSADLVLSVSPSLRDRFERAAGRSGAPVMLTPNGVDTERFRPSTEAERRESRCAHGWPDDQPVVLFVGFFSRDKRPDLLFRAWRRLAPGLRAKLVYVGAAGSGYYEIDASLARTIQAQAAAAGRADDVVFAPPTNEIERYFRAADVFALPSAREAHPLALLEAMACGLPAVASRLAGATDVLVDDGVSGRLVPVDDEQAFADALGQVLADRAAARAMGARARQAVLDRYDIRHTAEQWLAAYHRVLPRTP